MLIAIFNVLDLLLRVLGWVIILQVILSWLVAFNVINTSSDGVRRFVAGIDRFLEPLYRPIRRIMPDFGGLDLSPIVLLLAIQIVRMLLGGLAAEVVTTV